MQARLNFVITWLKRGEMSIQPISLKVEFRKNSALKEEDVAALRDWTLKQPHLPFVDDLQLILFLYSCNYGVELAKRTLDTFYTVRTHVPELFAARDPMSSSVSAMTRVVGYAPLPSPTPSGHRVVLCRLLDCDPSHYIFADALKLFCIVIELLQLETGTAPGLIIVFDMTGVVLGHVARLGIMTMKKFLFYLQEAMPVRLTGLHFLHTVSFMDRILALMKPFMKAELLSVLRLHADVASLQPHVPTELLPMDYQGAAPPFTDMCAKQVEKISANRDWILSEQSRRVDESRRPGKPKDAGDLFGIEGTFKKLDID